MDTSKNHSNENLNRGHYNIGDYVTSAVKVVSLGTLAFLGAEALVTELGWNRYTSSMYVPKCIIETEEIEDFSRIIWTRQTTEHIYHSPLWRILINSYDQVIIEERKVGE